MYNLDLILQKSSAQAIRTKASYEQSELEKRMMLITERSTNSTRILGDRVANRAKFQADLDSATAKFNALPEGQDKIAAKLLIQECQVRLTRIELAETKGSNPEDAVMEAYDLEETEVLLTLIRKFIAAVDARIAEL